MKRSRLRTISFRMYGDDLHNDIWMSSHMLCLGVGKMSRTCRHICGRDCTQEFLLCGIDACACFLLEKVCVFALLSPENRVCNLPTSSFLPSESKL